VVQTPPLLLLQGCATSWSRIVLKHLSQIESSAPYWNPTNSTTGLSSFKVQVLSIPQLSSCPFEESWRRHSLSMPCPFYHVTSGCDPGLNYTKCFGLRASTLSTTANPYVPELQIDELKRLRINGPHPPFRSTTVIPLDSGL
jgi:hypothetical protein